jgi:hypothetical protein
VPEPSDGRLGQQVGLDLGARQARAGGDEPLDRPPARRVGGLDEVLALGHEATGGTLGLAGELADLLELVVVVGW